MNKTIFEIIEEGPFHRNFGILIYDYNNVRQYSNFVISFCKYC